MKKLVLLFAAIATSATTFAQIPNAGFENWDNTGGYNTPTGWDNPNATTNPLSIYTCVKGTPGYVGASYLQLTSKTVAGFGVVPGVAVSGILDIAAAQPKSGFAYNQRPASLKGEWQYMAYGSDAGHIVVFLSHWNSTTMSRDTVAFTDHTLAGMVMSWASFDIPLNYVSGAFPDSAIIVLSASGTTPVANSYLYVDTLQFAGSVPSSVNNISGNNMNVSVSPNPSSSFADVTFTGTPGLEATISVSDISGKVIRTYQQAERAGVNTIRMNTEQLGKGVYLVTISDGQNRSVGKLAVQ